MMITPNAHVIDFNPEVRLPLMEAETLHSQQQEPVYTSQNHRLHDECIQAATRAARIRNASAAALFATYPIIIGEILGTSNVMDRYPGVYLTSVFASYFLPAIVAGKDRKVNVNRNIAVKYAAREVEDAQYSKVDPPDWAVQRLETADVTAHEVLHPEIAAAQKEVWSSDT